METKPVQTFDNVDIPVTLSQNSDGTFNVEYGYEVRQFLDYCEAAKILGECLMHSAACAGLMPFEEIPE